MQAAEKVTEIAAPREVVFDHWADARLWPRWSSLVTSGDLLSKGPIERGSRMQIVYAAVGLTTTHEVVEYDRPSILTIEVVEGNSAKYMSHAIRCLATEAGTRLMHCYRVQATGPLVTLWPFIQFGMSRRVRKDGTALKHYLERSPRVESSTD